MKKTLSLSLMLLVMGLLILSCKAKKSAGDHPSSAPNPQPQVSNNQSPPLIPNQTNNNFLASISRSSCRGSCPVYTATVYRDGRVIFEGKAHTKYIGTFQATLKPSLLKAIEQRAIDIGFFNFADRYPTGENFIADLPSCVTLIDLGVREKQVVNNNGAPQALVEFEEYLDSLLLPLPYQPSSGTNDK